MLPATAHQQHPVTRTPRSSSSPAPGHVHLMSQWAPSTSIETSQHGNKVNAASASCCTSCILPLRHTLCITPVVHQPWSVLNTHSLAGRLWGRTTTSTSLAPVSLSPPSLLTSDLSFPFALGWGCRRAVWLPRSLPGHVPLPHGPCHHPEGKQGDTKSHFEPGRNQPALDRTGGSTLHQNTQGEWESLSNSNYRYSNPGPWVPTSSPQGALVFPIAGAPSKMKQNEALTFTASTVLGHVFSQGLS